MPNWALVDYIVTGPREQLDSLYQLMKELQQMKESFVENDFGTTWLGNLVAKLGGDPMNIYCRGEWTFLQRNDNDVVISMEAAWGEPNEVRKFIEEKYPGLKIFFNSDSDDSWSSNDKEFKYFDGRFHLYTVELGHEYTNDIGELIQMVESVTGISNLNTFDDCEREISKYSEQKELEEPSYFAYIEECKLYD